MSELVTNKITPATGSSDTVTLGDSGDTFTIPAGVTLAGSGASLTALPAANLTGTTAIANGGTGAATHTANNVLVGNGTSAIASVAPSTSGNVLTSTGSAWASSTPSAGGLLEYSRGAKNGTITISSTTPIDVGIRANLNPTSTSDIIRIQHYWGSADSTAGTAQHHELWKSLDGGTFTQHLQWGNYINHWVFASSTFRTTSSLWWTGTAGDLGWSTGVLSVGVKIALQSSNTWIYNEGFGFTANGAAKQLAFIEASRYSSTAYTAGTDA
jgi:hypothetical protein